MLTCLHTDCGSFHTMMTMLNGCDRHFMACKASNRIWLFAESRGRPPIGLVRVNSQGISRENKNPTSFVQGSQPSGEMSGLQFGLQDEGLSPRAPERKGGI